MNQMNPIEKQSQKESCSITNIILEDSFSMPLSNYKRAIRIVCLSQYKCLLIYASYVIIFNLENQKYRLLFVNYIQDLQDLNRGNFNFTSCEKGGFYVQIHKKHKTYKFDQEARCQVLKIKGEIDLLDPNWRAFTTERNKMVNMMYYYIDSIQGSNNPILIEHKYYFTADLQHVIQIKQNWNKYLRLFKFELIKLSTKEKRTVTLPKYYCVSVSAFKNIVGVFLVSDIELIIVEVVDEPKIKSKILMVNLETKKEQILFSTKNKIVSFKGLNQKFTIIMFHMEQKFGGAEYKILVNAIFDYSTKKIILSREELYGIKKGMQIYQTSPDLRYSVQLYSQGPQQSIIYRRSMEIKKIVFHLIKNSYLSMQYGYQTLMTKIIKVLK